MGESLTGLLSTWLCDSSFTIIFGGPTTLPCLTFNIGPGIHDNTRSGIEYHKFCELAPAALIFITVFVLVMHTTR